MTPTPDRMENTGAADRNRGISQTKTSLGRSLLVLIFVLMLAAGVALAGSQGGTTVGAVPVFLVVVAGIFLVQFIAFIPAWLNQTEKFFDLVGSLTYIGAILGGLVLSGHTDATSFLLAGAVVVWAARLGWFLFNRVRRAGADDRFDAIKPNFGRFLTVWTIQGLWITLTLSAALAAVTVAERPKIGVLTIAGLLIWLVGFVFEVVADFQKSQFRANPANKGTFIRTGLWSWSRHPNYFGEIVLWSGIAIAALPALHGWQHVTLISPVFVFLLLTRVSGVPLLEKKAEARWGGQADYQTYKASTPLLVPRPRPRGERDIRRGEEKSLP